MKNARADIIRWCQNHTKNHTDLKISGFKSFRNGLGLCAILHDFDNNCLDYYSLKPSKGEQNIALALHVADTHFGIPALVDVEDISQERPDSKIMFTFLSTWRKELAAFQPRKPAAKTSKPLKQAVVAKQKKSKSRNELSEANLRKLMASLLEKYRRRGKVGELLKADREGRKMEFMFPDLEAKGYTVEILRQFGVHIDPSKLKSGGLKPAPKKPLPVRSTGTPNVTIDASIANAFLQKIPAPKASNKSTRKRGSSRFSIKSVPRANPTAAMPKSEKRKSHRSSPKQPSSNPRTSMLPQKSAPKVTLKSVPSTKAAANTFPRKTTTAVKKTPIKKNKSAPPTPINKSASNNFLRKIPAPGKKKTKALPSNKKPSSKSTTSSVPAPKRKSTKPAPKATLKPARSTTKAAAANAIPRKSTAPVKKTPKKQNKSAPPKPTNKSASNVFLRNIPAPMKKKTKASGTPSSNQPSHNSIIRNIPAPKRKSTPAAKTYGAKKLITPKKKFHSTPPKKINQNSSNNFLQKIPRPTKKAPTATPKPSSAPKKTKSKSVMIRSIPKPKSNAPSLPPPRRDYTKSKSAPPVRKPPSRALPVRNTKPDSSGSKSSNDAKKRMYSKAKKMAKKTKRLLKSMYKGAKKGAKKAYKKAKKMAKSNRPQRSERTTGIEKPPAKRARYPSQPDDVVGITRADFKSRMAVFQ